MMTKSPPPLAGIVGLVLWLNSDRSCARCRRGRQTQAEPIPPPSTGAQVAADPVVIELVVVVPVQKLTPPAPAGVAENNSSPVEELTVIVVVVNVHVHVEAVRQLRDRLRCWSGRSPERRSPRPRHQVGGREFTLAYVDAAGKRSSVAVDPVVGDLQVMTPAVDEDAAAALGAVGDAQAVDAGRDCTEVARERIRHCRSATDWLRRSGHCCSNRVAGREGASRERIGSRPGTRRLSTTP